MKVAMLTTTGDRCGIAAYTRALVDGLRTVPDTSVEVVPISEGRQPTAHYVEQAEKLNAPDIDVIHIQHEHSFWGGIMPRSSAFWELRYLLKKPIVLTAHTTYSLEQMLRVKTEKRPLQRIAKEILLRNRSYRESVDTAPFVTAITIVHTEAAKQELISRGVQPRYLRVIPTGVPDRQEPTDNGEAFRRAHRLEDRVCVTIFGYIAPNKGYELAIETLNYLDERVVLVIAGGERNEGMVPYVNRLKTYIKSSGLEDRVRITGYLSNEDVANAMAASDLVLVPHTEATGSYSVMLPITHAKPILASDQACFVEINARLKCLDTFHSGDVPELTSHVQKLLECKPLRDELSAAAADYAIKFSWNAVARMTRKVYEDAVHVYTSLSHHG